MPARALEFTILTAARSGEALGARWAEIDLGRKLWTMPAQRMKGAREHRVPLSGRSAGIVEAMAEARTSDFVFPGVKPGKPLSSMALEMVLLRLRLDCLRRANPPLCGSCHSAPPLRRIADV
jgi:integrase